MQPLVSILIPAFNAEPFVAATIRSALAQTWPRKEIIVVDDGSSDQTLAIAQQFVSPALAVVSQPHLGAAAARNKALSLCVGDYIQWLDADDLLAPDKIAKQLEAVGGSDDRRTLLSSAWGHFRYRPHKAKLVPTALWSDLSPADWLVRKLGQNLYMQNATWLVSRELTEAAGPWDIRLSVDDDGEYFCRVILASDGIRFLLDARAFYRRSPGSLSYIGDSSRKMESQFLSMQMHIGYLRSIEDSDRARAACLNYLQRALLYVYPERQDLMHQAQQLAASLGGQLATPQLSWKYAWIQKLFGWTAAKRAQLCYNRYKSALTRFWDRSLARLENRTWTLKRL
jgi:glycosyltransferase involved in cell wall biosynthesis